MELHALSLAQASRLLGEKKISATELTSAFLARIETHDKTFNSFITRDASDALARAEWADREIASGNHGVFTGIPVALKDLLCTKGCAPPADRKFWIILCRNTMPRWWKN